ncbi:hypothetical protein BJF90_19415 [Pseudonocardia sp. CNS-004]|nr:hypothetical protein BJF90_19415 [Pseudonocardia sp. CNS-004]
MPDPVEVDVCRKARPLRHLVHSRFDSQEQAGSVGWTTRPISSFASASSAASPNAVTRCEPGRWTRCR